MMKTRVTRNFMLILWIIIVNLSLFNYSYAVVTGPGSAWQYCRRITLSPPTPDSNLQVKITLASEQYSNMKSDGSDLRFYDINNNSCSYWIETWNNTGNSVIWVKVPVEGTIYLYMYYGNTVATKASNGATTFDFFDGFDGSNLGANWLINSANGSIAVAEGAVTISSLADWTRQASPYIYSFFIPSSSSFWIETKHKESNYFRIRFYALNSLESTFPWDYGYFYDGQGANSTANIYWKGWRTTKVTRNTDYLSAWEITDGSTYNWYTFNYSTGSIIDTINATYEKNVRSVFICASEFSNTSTIVDWIRVRKRDAVIPVPTIGDQVINISAAITAQTNTSCGQSNGSATVTATGGSGTYTYNWNTSPTQNTQTVLNLHPGTFAVTVTESSINISAIAYLTISPLVTGPGKAWQYCRRIILDPVTPESNLQVKVTLESGQYTNMKPDGSDLRFYDLNNNACSYWIETWNNTGNSVIWVKVPTQGTTYLYMYYGNASATSSGNGSDTFDFFDDFDGPNLNANWTSSSTNGTINVVEGFVTLSNKDGGTTLSPSISSAFVPGSNSFWIEAKHMEPQYCQIRYLALRSNNLESYPFTWDMGYFYPGYHPQNTAYIYWNGYRKSEVTCNTDYLTAFQIMDGSTFVWYTYNYNTGLTVDSIITTCRSTLRGIFISASYAVGVSTIVDWVRVRKNNSIIPIPTVGDQVTNISASVTAQTNTFCGQSNGSATVAATGGSGIYTYNWNTCPTQTTQTAVNLSEGIFTAIVTESSIGISAAAPVSIAHITAPSQPSVITGITAPCQGSAQFYSVTNVPGVTYTWSFPSGWAQTAGGTTNSVTVLVGTAPGTVQVTPSNSCGNGPSQTFEVSVSPLPAAAGTITGPSSVCQGQNSVIYTIPQIANATSYVWTLPSGAIGASSTNSITLDYSNTVSSGDLTVKGNNLCGNGNSSTLPIAVTKLPATPVITVDGFILHSNVATGNQWYNQAGIINGATNQDYTAISNGDYYDIVIINGCSSNISNIITIKSIGIEFIENSSSIKVYPNPVSDDLVVELEGNTENVTFEILNSTGHVVLKGGLTEKSVINTNSFSPGIYLLKMEMNRFYFSKKIIKM